MKWPRSESRYRALVELVFAFSAAFLAACGSPEQDTSVRAEAPSSSLAEPEAVPIIPPDTAPSVPPIEPLASQLENTNVRDGGLGSLCWARWEVARLIVEASIQEESPVGLEEASRSLTELREQLPAIEAELDRVMNQVPVEVRPFVERFKNEVLTARQSAGSDDGVEGELQELASQFDFESYPAALEYDELSRTHAGCLRP